MLSMDETVPACSLPELAVLCEIGWCSSRGGKEPDSGIWREEGRKLTAQDAWSMKRIVISAW